MKVAQPRLLVVAVVLGCPFTACVSSRSTQTTTVEEVEQKVDHALPLGSTRQEIEAWLLSQGIEKCCSDHPGDSSEIRRLPDADKYRSVIHGLIQDTDRSFWVTGSIQVYFLLDSDERLAKRLVKWVGTGP
jgi:hypothetical protein